jgi:hypothetical protein
MIPAAVRVTVKPNLAKGVHRDERCVKQAQDQSRHGQLDFEITVPFCVWEFEHIVKNFASIFLKI